MRPEKQLIAKEYAARTRPASGIVVTDYRGLSSEAFNLLRSEVTALEADCLVVKNRIIKYLLKDEGLELLDPFFQGQTAIVITDNELPKLLKVIIKFEDEQGAPCLKAAIWDGTLFDAADLKQLAELPSREELLSRVFSGMKAPLSGLAGVLNGVLAGLVITIKAIHDQKVRAEGSNLLLRNFNKLRSG